MIVDGGGGYRVKGGGPGRMVMVKVRYNTSMHTSCNFSLVVLKPLTKQAVVAVGLRYRRHRIRSSFYSFCYYSNTELRSKRMCHLPSSYLMHQPQIR